MNEQKRVLNKIEQLRNELSKSVHEKGYTHANTIETSQKLDHYLNVYDQLVKGYQVKKKNVY